MHQDHNVEIMLTIAWLETKSEDLSSNAMHVPHVDNIKFQTEEEMDVIQHQDQLVLAFSITLLVVTNALIAQLDKFQITKEDNATQHQLVLDQAKSEVPHKIASDAKLAQPHLYQMLIELDV